MKEICATLHSPRTLDKIDTSSSRACQAVCKGLYITEGVMGGGGILKKISLWGRRVGEDHTITGRWVFMNERFG